MKSNTLQFVFLLLVAIGAGPASSQMYRWSQTPGTNSNVDPHINYSLGMAPSAVGSSARAEMAELAKWRDDISGLITTGGISTAYTATTNQGLCVAPSSTTTPIDGQLLSVTVNSTNGISPTLQADSCNAFPIQSSAGVAVAAASLISGSPYTLRFSVANSAWMLRDFYSSSALNVPLGGLVPYTGTTVPNSNFVFPAGQCLSTTTYNAYWVMQGSPASGSCAGGQFQIIDMSGRVAAGLDTMPGFSAKNRLTSASTGCGTAMTSVGAVCVNGSENHNLSVTEMPSHNHTVTDPGHTHGGVQPSGGSTNSSGTGGSGIFWVATTGSTASATTGVTIQNTGGGTAHPIVQPTIGVTYLLRVI